MERLLLGCHLPFFHSGGSQGYDVGIAYVLIQRHLSPRHLGRGTRTADRHRIADVPRAGVLEKGLDGTRGALWATLGLPGMFVADGLDRPLRDGRAGVSKVASRVVLALCVGVGAGSFFCNSFKDHLRHTEGGYGSSSLVGLGCWLHDSISLRRFQEEAQDVLQAVARRS